jgi:hypothetical protein
LSLSRLLRRLPLGIAFLSRGNHRFPGRAAFGQLRVGQPCPVPLQRFLFRGSGGSLPIG